MRGGAILLMWAAASVNAMEITTTGYAPTVEGAIQNAKTLAVEEVAGAFLTTTSNVVDDRFHSRIDQYSGGVIKTYQVLTVVTGTGDLIEVTIKADVDADKINQLILPQGDVPKNMADEIAIAQEKSSKVREMTEALDRPQDAFVVRGKIVKYVNHGDVTDITVVVGMALSPKWSDDVRKFSKMAGKRIDTDNSMSDALWGLGTLLTPFTMGASTVITALARHTETSKVANSVYSYCFSKNRDHDVEECFEVGYDMPNVTSQGQWRVAIKLMSNDQVMQTLLAVVVNDSQLFANVRTGTNLYFRSSSHERKFTHPGVVLFQKGIAGGEYTHTVKTDLLTSIDRIEYELYPVGNLESWCNNQGSLRLN